MSLETIIRPFQSRDLVATRRIIATNAKIDVTPAVLTWGAAGAIPAAEQLEDPPDDGAGFKVITKKDTYLEDKRQTKTMRIYKNETDANGKLQIDPDTGHPVIDPDIFVDVKRIKNVDFRKKDPRKYSPGEDAKTQPPGLEVDITGKYSVAYAENQIPAYWNNVSADRKEQEVRYILKDQPGEQPTPAAEIPP